MDRRRAIRADLSAEDYRAVLAGDRRYTAIPGPITANRGDVLVLICTESPTRQYIVTDITTVELVQGTQIVGFRDIKVI